MSTRLFAGSALVAVCLLQIGQAQGGAPPAGQAPTPNQPAPVPNCPELAGALTRLLGSDVRLRDWPNLTRYREANRTVKNAQVVFMGDSITDSWAGQPRFNFFPGKPYVGRGISGQTTPQMLLRLRPDVIDLKAKVMVVLAGTNDIAGNTGPMTDEEIEGNLASMSELAAANGIKVVLSSILPVSDYHVTNNNPQTSQRPMTRIKAVNDWMKAYASKHGHIYLDYFPGMIDQRGLLKTELSGDDLHPNDKGYAIMSPLAEAAIAKALK
jgi:lysophospholipase L1-like esterase